MDYWLYYMCIRVNQIAGTDWGRAVSPVLGVILVVAVTVILSSVVGVFVLDLGSGTQETAQAGVSVEESDDSVSVTYVANGNVDKMVVDAPDSATVTGGDGSNEDELTSPGQTVSVTGLSAGESVTVIGIVDGNKQVVQTYSTEAAIASLSSSGTIDPQVG